MFVCHEETPKDIVEGVKLFVQRTVSRLNSLVDDAVAGDEEAIHAMFGDFITVASMYRQQEWRAEDHEGVQVEVFHLEDRIQEIVREVEL